MKAMDRREFLKLQLQSMAWMAGASLFLPSLTLAEGTPDLAVVKGDPAAAVRAAVSLLGGMEKFVRKGNRVVIKPNMSFPVGPDQAANTHPLVVRTLAVMCREAGASRVLVLDNPLAPAERCLEMSGIETACRSVEDDMVHMITTPSMFAEKEIKDAKTLRKTDVMKDVLAADVLIAAPVAKSHSSAGVSLSMKGMMGLISDRRTMHRLDLQESIVDLSSLLRPHLVLIDATRVLSSGGPGGPGTVLKLNTVIASTDMVAADAYAVSEFEWYGKKFKPDQIKHIRYAHQRGLGRMDIENLNIKRVTL